MSSASPPSLSPLNLSSYSPDLRTDAGNVSPIARAPPRFRAAKFSLVQTCRPAVVRSSTAKFLYCSSGSMPMLSRTRRASPGMTKLGLSPPPREIPGKRVKDAITGRGGGLVGSAVSLNWRSDSSAMRHRRASLTAPLKGSRAPRVISAKSSG